MANSKKQIQKIKKEAGLSRKMPSEGSKQNLQSKRDWGLATENLTKTSLLEKAALSLRLGWKTIQVKFRNKVAGRKIPNGPKSFKKERRAKTPKIEKSSKLIIDSFKFLGRHWKTFTILLFFYIVSYFILAYARPNIDLPSLFKEANSAGTQVGVGDKLKTLSSAMFTYRGNAGDFARWAQFFLAVIFSLVFIYAIRELKQGKQIRARDALYGGTGNLVPFMMNIGLIALQLIPFTMVSVIYNIGMSRQLFVNNLEKFSATVILVLAGLLTFWFIPTAIISLYAITLPGVYPSRTMQAVRIMVSRRRLEVLKNLLVFILFITLSYLILLLMLVTYIPAIANLSLDLFFLIALPMIHVMMYSLYIKLLEGTRTN